MKFFNVKTRQSVEVPDDKVEMVTMKNGRKAAKTSVDGINLFKILSKEDISRISK